MSYLQKILKNIVYNMLKIKYNYINHKEFAVPYGFGKTNIS